MQVLFPDQFFTVDVLDFALFTTMCRDLFIRKLQIHIPNFPITPLLCMLCVMTSGSDLSRAFAKPVHITPASCLLKWCYWSADSWNCLLAHLWSGAMSKFWSFWDNIWLQALTPSEVLSGPMACEIFAFNFAYEYDFFSYWFFVLFPIFVFILFWIYSQPLTLFSSFLFLCWMRCSLFRQSAVRFHL